MEASSKNVKSVEDDRRRILQKAEKDRLKAQSMGIVWPRHLCYPAPGRGAGKGVRSVNTRDIEQCAVEMELQLERKWIVLEEPIRELGTFRSNQTPRGCDR